MLDASLFRYHQYPNPHFLCADKTSPPSHSYTCPRLYTIGANNDIIELAWDENGIWRHNARVAARHAQHERHTHETILPESWTTDTLTQDTATSTAEDK